MLSDKEEGISMSRAALLDLMRRGDITDWPSLCSYVGMSLFELGTTNESGYWIKQVATLRSTGFLRIETSDYSQQVPAQAGWLPPELDGKFIVTDRWRDVQSAFKVGLTDLANLARQGSAVMRPVFGPPKEDHRDDVFVLMPFAVNFDPVYRDHILKVTEKLNLSSKRADDLYSSTFIVQDIWNSINSAKVIIADCTSRNPNVFYELGMAHTVGKSTIIITQDDSIPFDINYIRLIKYQYTPRGMEEFEQKLEQYLTYILRR